jgi:hypothetical protein
VGNVKKSSHGLPLNDGHKPETSMVRHQSDVVRRDIRMSSGHPMAVGRVGWVTDILWISVCYQGNELNSFEYATLLTMLVWSSDKQTIF